MWGRIAWTGQTILKGDEGTSHLLFHIAFDQRAEDLQDCSVKGIRSQVHDTGDYGDGRTIVDIPRSLKEAVYLCSLSHLLISIDAIAMHLL